MNQSLIDNARNLCKLALLFLIVAGTSFAWSPRVAAQETTFDTVKQVISPRARDTFPRDDFFSTEALDDKARLLSEELLLKALDSEAFYTLVGQLKPVSEGFWGGYFSVEPAGLTEIEQVRAALRSWNVPGMFFADVLVYESLQHGQRYASAYVIHLPSLKELIERESEFFARWGITVNTPPGEIMTTIERTRQPDDRWRGFGLVFGYPKYAIDFFVTAGMHQRTSGEFVERDFRQVATFAGRSGRFVYAVPKLSRPGPEDIALQRRAALLLNEYKRLRPQYTAPTKNPSGLLRDWMDDGHGRCHPDHLLAKLPAKTEAELDAEIASWSAAEVRPPEVKFNHLYVVLSQGDFDAVRTSDFLLNQFAASDQGFPKFLAVDGPCQSIYLRGRDTYIELFGPENKFGEPVGKIGVGWTVEKVGELDVLQGLLTKDSPDSFTRVLNQWDFDREGAAVNWYHSLFRKQPTSSEVVWWFSETHVDFIPALYPDKSSDGDRISRQDFLAARYDATRILKNFTNLTVHLPLEAARSLRSDLDRVGWRSEAELSPGVVLERRMLLGGGLGLLAGLFSPNWPGIFGQEPPADSSSAGKDSIELETLIARLRPEARRLIASEKPDEEAYLRMAIKELLAVNKLDTNRYMESRNGGWEMDFQAFVPPVLLYQIRMSPNSVIDLHDHRHHNGALSVREGSIRVRSFDIFQEGEDKKWDVAAGKVPAMEEEFLIQEKGESVLKQGQAVGLTRTRDNIHQIEAGPDGCLMYDLFTNFKMNAQSFEIKWDGQYFDRTKKLCKVLWIPPDHTHE